MARPRKRGRKPTTRKQLEANIQLEAPHYLTEQVLMADLMELAALPSDKVHEIISVQIGAMTLAVNHLALDSMKQYRNESSDKMRNALALRLSLLGKFSDSVSKQKAVLLHQMQIAPPHVDSDRAYLLTPPELPDAEWEKKYGGTFNFGKKPQ